MNSYRTQASTSAYLDTARTTASPATLLCLVYDRLLLDLERADAALATDEPAHTHLRHAQDIVIELLSTLDQEAWSGAPALAALYSYLHTQLVNANVRRDRALVATCRGLVAPLRDAWHAAARGVELAPGTPVAERVPMTPLSA